ncbi:MULTISPECIES: hypothetical protein [Pseudomonas]|jgi:uncharacterized membrane protein|uniref:Membrane protein n=2 Tax=Pseudomonas TaxID=286 RepID=A0ACC5MCD3_9PSED|nr:MULTISPECIES: hypothetical protein [Pseudomonas]ATE77936.1 hypothetical protein CNN82_16410 [Pseudomonas frederiksbergensis]MBB2886383.1 putative membrane protein [Pseudomonas umsongensis]NMN75229.1 hypothetical protein [Pseudomonas sp. KD5]CAH0139011.1 hypothetical protein SRABI123_00435 [Pseudomonas sp. Bi123]
MNGTMTSEQATACLNLALERNRQLFNEAYDLSRAALDLLDQPHMDAEKFTQYQEKRRNADRKYQEAIEHLRLIMAEYPVHPCSAADSSHQPSDSAKG